MHPGFGTLGQCSRPGRGARLTHDGEPRRIPMGQDDLIQLDNVTKTYQAGAPPALADLSMDVAAGEVAAGMGPSGSGQSTPLKPIARVDRAPPGTGTVGGGRVGKLRESGAG